ncbi:hypothetical protein SUGI_0671570 [Cryptomeria japonica]|nr:hypothetical protein SUGI_0671570 [Cryptomeria japonica]
MRNPSVRSTMWNLLVKSKVLVLPHLSWEINSTSKALFWRESWNVLPPLDSMGKFPNAQDDLKRLWGKKVYDYLSFSRSNGVVKAKWKDIPDGVIPIEEKDKLVNVLNQSSVFVSNEEDKLNSTLSKSGKYLVKEGYISLLKGVYSVKSRERCFCWHDAVLPKAGAFQWLALHNRILTRASKGNPGR